MAVSIIRIDADFKERICNLAAEAGLEVDEFVTALLRRIAEGNIRLDRGVPVFPRRSGAHVLTVADVDRLADGKDSG
jgi:antitoxin component of RelBE/YafQ-DinJ toxin-antitoxin module